MNGLHNLVTSGKVLYLVSPRTSRIALPTLPKTAHRRHSQGISDTPAWIVSKANLYARLMGKTPFVIYQGAWSILQRDFERDIIPMCRAEGMALAPWNVLGAGKIRSDAQERARHETGEKGESESPKSRPRRIH